MAETLVYVGTYTDPGRSEGIYVYRLDLDSGALTHVQTVPDVRNPSWVELDSAGRRLFATEEVHEDGRAIGMLAAFARDPASGHLTFLNRQPTHGGAPCHLAVDPSGRYAVVANYTTGNMAVLPVGTDGHLGEATHVLQHAGSGPNPRRQTGPHAHAAVFDPAGRYLLACDLGIDKVLVYQLDVESGRLVDNDPPWVGLHGGAGPRHLAFHPSGRFAYVNGELDSTITAFAYDGAHGTLRPLQVESTLPTDFDGDNTTAEIAVHPSGRFVYVSNRGADSLAIFAIDETSGRMRAVGHEPTQGRTPRGFGIDPSGTFLLAGNQNSDTIVTFRIDQSSGRLVQAGPFTQVPSPVCVQLRAG